MKRYNHNGGPDLEEPVGDWHKSYFYMPIERAIIQIKLLQMTKSTMAFPSSKKAKEMIKIIDEQIEFLKGKIV